MPSFGSTIQSTLAHILVAAFVIWAAGMKLDSLLSRGLEKLEEKELIPAELLDIIQSDDQQGSAETLPTGTPVQSAPTTPPDAPEPPVTAPEIQPSETELPPIEYAGNSSTTAALQQPNDSSPAETVQTATETLPVPFNSAPPVPVSGQLLESDLQETGLKAPRLRLQLDTTLIDTLLTAGVAHIIVELPVKADDAPSRLLLSGTIQSPRNWETLTHAAAETLSERGIEIQSSHPALQQSLTRWGLGREHSRRSRFWLMFTRRFDRYILEQQLAAVSHLPAADHAERITAVSIWTTTDGQLLAKARLEPQ